jgi:hypothetical protein
MGILKTPRATTAERTGITPAASELIYDTDLAQMFLGDGLTAGGVAIGSGSGSGSSVTVAATAPADPEAGDEWWDSETGEKFVYYEDADSGQWVQSNSQVAAAVKVSGQAQGWKDMLAPLTAAGVPNNNAPSLTNFVVGTNTRREYAFAVNDYIYVQPFHINHDVAPGGAAYVHVHWTTSGTRTASVKWEFQIVRALGHNQANFTQSTTITVEQAAAGTAYRHMVAEVAVADALTLTEPDELILVTLKRVTNGATDNSDTVFGLMVDFHYESDRDTTPNKSPNFFG